MSESTQNIESFVRSELREVLTSVADETFEALLRHVLTIVQEAIVRERERCVQICLDRAELWGKTTSAQSSVPALARDEARARQNEATYLADFLQLKSKVFTESRYRWRIP